MELMNITVYISMVIRKIMDQLQCIVSHVNFITLLAKKEFKKAESLFACVCVCFSFLIVYIIHSSCEDYRSVHRKMPLLSLCVRNSYLGSRNLNEQVPVHSSATMSDCTIRKPDHRKFSQITFFSFPLNHLRSLYNCIKAVKDITYNISIIQS